MTTEGNDREEKEESVNDTPIKGKNTKEREISGR